MSTPPTASPEHTLLPSLRPHQQSDTHPPLKRQRTENASTVADTHLDNVVASLATWHTQTHPDTSHSSTLPPNPVHQSDTLTHEQRPSDTSHPPPSTSPTTSSSTHKEGRRVWNRRLLEQNGASPTLLDALDTFITTAPIIPTLKDSSRKIYVRNMRGWILHLELQNDLWDPLIRVLRADDSYTATCPHWDRDLCRYILGRIVQDNQKQQSQNHPKQSRQAVNNAIKRELTCPLESGNSSRGKTFRDLFRMKCRKGDVELPEIETPPAKRHSEHHDKPATPAETVIQQPPPAVPAPVAQSARAIAPAAGEESFVMYLNMPPTHAVPTIMDDSELSKLRLQCGETDEWDRTAWWKLASHGDIKKLPRLLAHAHLYELYSLLTDFRWISRTFHCVDFTKGMRQIPTIGYDVMLKYTQKAGADHPSLDIEGFRLIRNALMLILPILSQENRSDPSEPTFIAHLATQLVGRLLDLKRRFPNIACLIQSIEEHAPRPWLRPLTRCFHQPRTDIKLAVPSNGIFTPHLISLSEDGTLLATSATSFVEVKKESSRMVSNSSQRPSTAAEVSDPQQQMPKRKVFSVVIWDVQSGKCVCKGPEIPNILRHLTLSRDNNCIIGETVDGLFFWHMDKSQEMWTIAQQVEAAPRIKSISSITAAVGSSRVLTTHRLEQEPIVLWDSKTGKKVQCYDEVTSPANCVDVSGAGDYFASGHDNGFIHLWKIEDKVPLLSFKNEGADRGPQQVVALSDVNRTGRTQYPTISISFYEKGEERWLTAVSANHIIRVWLLPPRHISHDQWKSFVSSRRTAVVKCPLIRRVEWSQDGNFFTGGEDGVARMWRRTESGKWEWYAIEKENGERSLDLSNVEVSCGKRSEVVATYVAKSAYVTVWDMSSMERAMKSGKRRRLYRWYSPMVANSVDSRDICGAGGAGGGGGIGGGGGESEVVKGSEWMRTYGDNIGLIRTELGRFFGKLDPKSSTEAVEKMQPWLRVKPGGARPGQEEDRSKALRVCFEQPVRAGQSGVFKNVSRRADTSIGDMYGMSMGLDDRGWEEKEGERRGMAAALQDGTIRMFEVEGLKGKEEVIVVKRSVDVAMVGVGKDGGVDGGGGGGVEEEKERKERNGMETYKLPASMYVDEDEGGSGGKGAKTGGSGGSGGSGGGGGEGGSGGGGEEGK